jgi:hypothetical protein
LLLYASMTGLECSWKVFNRFLIVSTLSSTRPEKSGFLSQLFLDIDSKIKERLDQCPNLWKFHIKHLKTSCFLIYSFSNIMFHLLAKLTDPNCSMYGTTGIYNCNLQMAFTTMYVLQHCVITWWFSAVDETGGHGFVADVEVDDLCARTNLLLELLALHDYRIL